MERKLINCPHCGKIIPDYILNGEIERPQVIYPDCGSQKNCKSGFRSTKKGKAQTYLCQKCGRRFT